MRDPLAPIPSPTVSPNFWDTALLPRGTRVGGDEPVEEFSPLRLLQRDQGDTHGLDRRSRRRGGGQALDALDHGSARLLSSVHTVRRALLGLSTAHGWALVHTLTVAPTGLLVHLLDLLKPGLNPELRDQGRSLLARIAPLLGAPLRPRAIHRPGSPLATIGGCLLAPRVVADLFELGLAAERTSRHHAGGSRRLRRHVAGPGGRSARRRGQHRGRAGADDRPATAGPRGGPLASGARRAGSHLAVARGRPHARRGAVIAV
ncbi:hypothetical protein [Nannocystis pusilla]|uniref:hypothetical protein n=1 Tax=Nannocystis pusilla TaxID=889268 RepID=UPI003DA3EF24